MMIKNSCFIRGLQGLKNLLSQYFVRKSRFMHCGKNVLLIPHSQEDAIFSLGMTSILDQEHVYQRQMQVLHSKDIYPLEKL